MARMGFKAIGLQRRARRSIKVESYRWKIIRADWFSSATADLIRGLRNRSPAKSTRVARPRFWTRHTSMWEPISRTTS